MAALQAKIQAQGAFLQWLRANHPQAYQHALSQTGTLAGFSDTVTKIFDTVTNAAAKLGTAYVQGKAAYELLQANIKRAKAGLQPANSLAEAQQFPAQYYQQSGFGGMPQWVIYAGVGVIVYMLIKNR
jgi:hypothetical protein